VVDEHDIESAPETASPVSLATQPAPVVRPAVQTTFVVVDRVTGEPITRFGLEITRAGAEVGWDEVAARDEAILESAADREAGRFRCSAEPVRDQVRILAPGYAPEQQVVKHASARSDTQEIRLWPASLLRGRVMVHGHILSGVRVLLRGESLFREEGSEEAILDTNEAGHYWIDGFGAYDPFWLSDPIADLRTDAFGKFDIVRLAPGNTYRLEFESSSFDRLVFDPLEIQIGTVHDFGDVELAPAGRIEGHVTMPEGTDMTDLVVWTVFLGHRGLWTKLDNHGDFVFERVPPTTHHLDVERIHLPFLAQATAVVAPDSTARVEMTLTEQH
jgi:hypothetical protein